MGLTSNHMFIREIWRKKFKKVNSVNLFQISLLNMLLLVQIFEIETSYVVNFYDTARFRIDFAIVSVVLFEGTSLVPIWNTIWSKLSLKIGYTWSAIHLTVAPWKGGTNTLVFSFKWNIIPLQYGELGNICPYWIWMQKTSEYVIKPIYSMSQQN